MESYPEASVPVGGVLQPESLHLPILGDYNGSDGFSEVLLDQYTEVDVSSEWLSSFVEECLSSAGNCLLPPKDHQTPATTATTTGITNTLQLAIPAKTRGRRKRREIASSSKTHKNPLTKWSEQLRQRSSYLYSAFSDPPLLEQTHWLADSELLTMPIKKEEKEVVEEEDEEIEEMEEVEKENNQGQEQFMSRRCTHCQTQKTPQWRSGPMGPKTLCNACGMRYFKSGRLLPEYRPANSPTFMSFKHSNSHKKVLQMRMSLLSSSTSGNQ